MNILEKNSFCYLKKDYALSQSDDEVLSFLYLPILGSSAYSLYFAMNHYYELGKKTGGFLHDDFLSYLDMDSSAFVLARTKLEAIGLLETYRKEERDSQSQIKVSYLYFLLPPASPKKFFNDVLLRSLLNQAIGNKRYYFLSNYFQVQKKDLPEEYVKITTPFKDVFSVDVRQGDASLEKISVSLEDKNYKSQADFDKKKLKKLLSENQYPFSAIEEDLKSIEDAASLYNPKMEDVVKLILQNTDSDNHFYLDSFMKDIRSLKQFSATNRKKDESENIPTGNNEISKLIRSFNSVTPAEYLSIIFNAKPASFMLTEIENLKSTFGYSNSIINVILDYCLRKTNQEFNVTFIEKVAYTLSSMDVKDSYDAMVKLTSRDFEMAQTKRKRRTKKDAPEEKKDVDVEQSDIDDFNKEFSI